MTTTSNKWNDQLLDTMRTLGDPHADAVVRAIFADGEVASVNQLMRLLFRNDAPLPQQMPERARAYFEETAGLPEWADREQIARGAALFGRHASRVMLLLAHYALPACYAARNGVQVLHVTGHLSKNPRPRLLETAQFICDVMAPNGLVAGGAGIRSAQKVRLTHAAVRHLIAQRDWNPEYGLPLNQEDMIGTLLTFSVVILDGLRKMGFSVSTEDADAFMLAWNVVGHLSGVHPALLPESAADGGALLLAIQRRQLAASPEGAQLTRVLLEMLQESTRGTPFANMPINTIRFFIGDAIADLLEIPPSDWMQQLLWPLPLLGRFAGQAQARLPFVTQLSEQFGCAMMDGLMRMERGGKRAEFHMPVALRKQSSAM
ncbi:MAG TPA: oxygenase MpaB family protein [Roseiflexaceae bacterium]|nr:oxygenase MpaB family protein [Roseiflexaceae bacterium]